MGEVKVSSEKYIGVFGNEILILCVIQDEEGASLSKVLDNFEWFWYISNNSANRIPYGGGRSASAP